MPSLRKKVTEFLRQLSANSSVNFDPETVESKDDKSRGCFIQRYLNGEHKGGLGSGQSSDRGGHTVFHGGKDGADLPNLKLEIPHPTIFAAYTGPDGGLTTVNRGTHNSDGSVQRGGPERHLSTDDPDVNFIDDGKEEGVSRSSVSSKQEDDGVYFGRSYGTCFRLRKAVVSTPVDNSRVRIRAMGTIFLCKGDGGGWEKERGPEDWECRGRGERTSSSSPGVDRWEIGEGGLGMRKSSSAPSQRGPWSLSAKKADGGAGETTRNLEKSSSAADATDENSKEPDDTDREIAGIQGGWNRWNRRAYGVARSLYERHPVSGRVAGSPVADAFAVVARRDSALLALADGVNWGHKAATAARAALHGSLRHLHVALYNPPASITAVKDTKDVFVALLRSFHEAHSMILQEEGMLTTLTVAAVLPIVYGEGRDGNIVNWEGDSSQQRWAVCVVNVGDSLAYVYNKAHGVREITMGSHDIHCMRDMRDALGALGPADGLNPELNNLTCSMTIACEGDVVFLTSDGVSDNFDPVVGKFAIPKVETPNPTAGSPSRAGTKPDGTKRSNKGGPRGHGDSSIPTSKSTGNVVGETGPGRPKLPMVEAHQRHALTLLRMEDLLVNGVSGEGAPDEGPDAVDLCHRLVDFATRLTAAKRHILEDPELYMDEGDSSAPIGRAEQRGRRRKVGERLAAVPGKLDHASVVAYVVGEYSSEEAEVCTGSGPAEENAGSNRVNVESNGEVPLSKVRGNHQIQGHRRIAKRDEGDNARKTSGKVICEKKENSVANEEKVEGGEVNGGTSQGMLPVVDELTDGKESNEAELYETGL